MPFLKEAYEEYKDKGLEILIFASHSNEEWLLKAYKKHAGVSFPFLRGSEKEETKKIRKEYNVDSVPTVFMLNRVHIVESIKKGYKKEDNDEFKKMIESIL